MDDDFKQYTMPSLPDYFAPGFWPELVKRVAADEPAVQHALNSLGAAHFVAVEKQGTGSSTISANLGEISPHETALQEYNAAITQLARIMATRRTRGTEIILVCCFLFGCIEVLFEDLDAAVGHCEAGLKVYREWSSNSDLDQEEESDILSSSNSRYCIWRLAAELEEMLGDLTDRPLADMDLLSVEPEELWSFGLETAEFLSVEHVSSAILFLHRKLKRLLQATATYQSINQSIIPDIVLEQHRELETLYASFEGPYHHFMSELPPEDVDRSILILQLRYLAQSTIHGSMFGRTPQSTSATQFQDLLETAELILKEIPPFQAPSSTTSLTYQSPEGTRKTPSFVLCAETVPCLFQAAKIAPTFQLRQRAIALLHTANAVEGIWNSHTYAVLAEELLEADL